jgi:septal ring factor EnvC (AmiA/AmiB activator)
MSKEIYSSVRVRHHPQKFSIVLYMATKNTSPAPDFGSLEQVRDILFGEQQRNFSKEIAALEARVSTLEKRSDDLERELASTRDELESRIRAEAQRQDKALNSEANRIDKFIGKEMDRLATLHEETLHNLESQRLRDRAKLANLLVQLSQQLEVE